MRSWLVAACAAAVGCSGAPSSSAGVERTVRDSAGIEISENRGAAPSWRLVREPLLELGDVDRPGPTQFYRVRDVELLRGGGLVVADGGSEELRIFTRAGEHRASAGGKGHGPTEFDGLARVESLGDSLLTWDGGNQRVSVRRLDGSLVRTFGLEWFDGILFPVDLFTGRHPGGDGGILAVTARYMSQLVGSGLVIDTALVSLYAPDGSLADSIARVPHNARAVLRSGDLQTTLGVPYLASAPLVGDGRGFCYAFGPAPEIRCLDRAGLRRLLRVELPVRPITEEHVSLWWERMEETSNERRRYALRRMRDHMPFPAAFPAFDQLLRDDRGRLWVRRYRTPEDESERWLVFEGGTWVGQLDTPAGYEVMDIRGDRLAGVWRDPLGIEFVRVHRFEEA